MGSVDGFNALVFQLAMSTPLFNALVVWPTLNSYTSSGLAHFNLLYVWAPHFGWGLASLTLQSVVGFATHLDFWHKCHFGLSQPGPSGALIRALSPGSSPFGQTPRQHKWSVPPGKLQWSLPLAVAAFLFLHFVPESHVVPYAVRPA